MSLHVVASFTAKPDSTTALRQLLVEIVESVRRAPGCLRCNLVSRQEAANEYTFIEEWTDRAAVDSHLAEPEVEADIAKILALVSIPPEVRLYSTC